MPLAIPHLFLFFSRVVKLKLLPKGFWPKFALRYVHSTTGEISGLVCVQVGGRNLAPSAAFSKQPQSTRTPIVWAWRFRHHGPGAAKFPDPRKPHIKVSTLVSCAENIPQPSALEGGCSTLTGHASMGAGCWLCSPRLHHLLGHNPAQLPVEPAWRKVGITH